MLIQKNVYILVFSVFPRKDDSMDLVSVNREKCVKCGFCINVCPGGVLGMTSDGPQPINRACIRCGHCVAVCPEDAIDNVKAPIADQAAVSKFPVLDAETAYEFMRSRRSVRCYENVEVPREKLLQLLEIARFAPSAGNSQSVAYVVVTDKEKLKQLTEATVNWMAKEVENGSLMGQYFSGVINHYRETGTDVILRDAPALIIATAPRNLARGRDNSHFALAYAELYATTLDLGSCWAGFLEGCAASGFQPLLDILNLPESNHVTGAIMVGYPKYTYRRLPNRRPLNVTWL